jgi:hypothetical protein
MVTSPFLLLPGSEQLKERYTELSKEQRVAKAVAEHGIYLA